MSKKIDLTDTLDNVPSDKTLLGIKSEEGKHGELIETYYKVSPLNSSQSQFSHVEISVDSKGNIKPNVKVYDDDPYKAMEKAVDVFKQTMNRFKED